MSKIELLLRRAKRVARKEVITTLQTVAKFGAVPLRTDVSPLSRRIPVHAPSQLVALLSHNLTYRPFQLCAQGKT